MKRDKHTTSQQLRPVIQQLIERFGSALTGDLLRETWYEVRGLPLPPAPAPAPLLHALLRLLPDTPEIARHAKTAQEALERHNLTAAQAALERAALWVVENSPPASSSPHGSTASLDASSIDFSYNALFATVIRELFLPFLNPGADLHEIGENLLHQLEREPLAALAGELRLFIEAAAPIAIAVSDHARDLTRLVDLMLRHLDSFVLEAELAHQQVAFIRDALTRMSEAGILEEASERLERLIDAQRKVIDERRQAETEIRKLLGVVIERLAAFAHDSNDYQETLSQTVRAVEKAKSLTELRDLLLTTIEKTQFMASNSRAIGQTAERLQRELNATRERIERLEAELRHLSKETLSDPLTGLMNRRGLEQFWARELARAQREKQPLAIALIDLDNFKKFNDTFGHLAGDKALQHLASIAKRYLRPQDGVARWGGEEFAVVLPEADAQVAERVIQRLQRELTKALFFIDNRRHVITFSAGVAQWRPGDTLEEVFSRADEALYEAKRTGKNRVVVAQS
jgi:diguanylate cyclase